MRSVGGTQAPAINPMNLARLVALVFFATVLARAAEPGLHRDIEYGVAAGVSLKLDASVPAGDGPFPVAILVHGGGWSGGDKANVGSEGKGADISAWFAPLTAAKFTWFSINYRLAPATAGRPASKTCRPPSAG